MQTLDARHFELFLCEGYQDESWDYTVIGSHETEKYVDGVSGAIFDLKHLKDASTSGKALKIYSLHIIFGVLYFNFAMEVELSKKI